MREGGQVREAARVRECEPGAVVKNDLLLLAASLLLDLLVLAVNHVLALLRAKRLVGERSSSHE